MNKSKSVSTDKTNTQALIFHDHISAQKVCQLPQKRHFYGLLKVTWKTAVN
jgi:hypothetical protein